MTHTEINSGVLGGSVVCTMCLQLGHGMRCKVADL